MPSSSPIVLQNTSVLQSSFNCIQLKPTFNFPSKISFSRFKTLFSPTISYFSGKSTIHQLNQPPSLPFLSPKQDNLTFLPLNGNKVSSHLPYIYASVCFCIFVFLIIKVSFYLDLLVLKLTCSTRLPSVYPLSALIANIDSS
jgi:hypothetical protein